jgi:succinylglutamic semialdehyde dehydrogenase
VKHAPSDISFRGSFIAGRFLPVKRGRRLISEDPGDLSNPVGEILFDPARVDDAVEAARSAFPGWRKRPMEERLSFLRRYQQELLKRKDVLARCISRETGKPLAESLAEVQTMTDKLDVTVREGLPLVADKLFPLDETSSAALRHRPRGVAAVIGPFNVPGHLPNGQILPALLTGNTVVFKPSELTPFVGQMMAECFQAAELPAGVFNLVQGDGSVGAKLSGHPDVDLVLFTGSYPTGKRISQSALEQPGKLIALEMGGKNAALVLDDASLAWTVKEIIHGAFSTTGQRCSSTSRVLVQRGIAKEFIKQFLEKLEGLKVGYFDASPFMGPLINAAAAEKFLAAQKKAARLGYETLREGKRLSLSKRGHYVSPSVHLWDRRWKTPAKTDYWDEELFAPDVAVYIMDSEEDMIAANNASRYGLVASVFTESEERFRRIMPELEDGVVHWNRTTAMTPGRLPFGGAKQSGNDWPAGLYASLACVSPVASVEVPRPPKG